MKNITYHGGPMFATGKLNEKGSALILSIMILFILTLLGIVGLNMTNSEINFAGNEKADHISLFEADSGAEVGKELIEQGIEERGWRESDGSSPALPLTLEGTVITNNDLYINGPLAAGDVPSDTNRDAYLDTDWGRTNLRIGANPAGSTGGAIQMISGYEGMGKGAAGGGGYILYDIRSQHDGPKNASSRILSQWIHVF